MPNFSFVPLEGTIQNIRPFGDECCSSLVTLQTSEGTVTVVVSSDTYVISEVRLRRGMTVAAFYDAQVPVPLIYPPQYRAVILGRKQPNETTVIKIPNSLHYAALGSTLLHCFDICRTN